MQQEFDNITKRIINDLGTEKDKLIPILQSVQDHFNYLPNEVLEKVSELTEISKAQITSVSTFYTQFRHKPAGKHTIKVCVGTACHVKGAGLVYDAVKRYLNLDDENDTDDKELFTLEEVACLGCCTLAPVVQIDDITYGKVNQNEIGQMLDDFLGKKEQADIKPRSFTKTKITNGEIRLGLGSCCVASGSEDVKNAVQSTLYDTGIQANVKQVGCVGMCHQVPLLELIPEGKEATIYSKVNPEDVKKIVSKHFQANGFFQKIKNNIIKGIESIYFHDGNSSVEDHYLDVKEKQVDNFLNKQIYIATELKGVLNPVDINEYQLKGGFIPRQMLVTQIELEGQINQYEFIHNLDHSDMALLLLHVQNRLVSDELKVDITE